MLHSFHVDLFHLLVTFPYNEGVVELRNQAHFVVDVVNLLCFYYLVFGKDLDSEEILPLLVFIGAGVLSANLGLFLAVFVSRGGGASL